MKGQRRKEKLAGRLGSWEDEKNWRWTRDEGGREDIKIEVVRFLVLSLLPI